MLDCTQRRGKLRLESLERWCLVAIVKTAPGDHRDPVIRILFSGTTAAKNLPSQGVDTVKLYILSETLHGREPKFNRKRRLTSR